MSRLRTESDDLLVKQYGLRRGPIRDAVRGLGHRLLLGKSAMGPVTRCAVEWRTLLLWQERGFEVPEVLGADVAGTPPALVMERVDGTSFSDVAWNVTARLPENLCRIRAFAIECARRHKVAARLCLPGLIHAHPSFAHVIERNGCFVLLDHECVYTDPRRIPLYVSHEIAGFGAELIKRSPARWPALLHAFGSAYTDRPQIERVSRDVRRGRLQIPNPFARPRHSRQRAANVLARLAAPGSV